MVEAENILWGIHLPNFIYGSYARRSEMNRSKKCTHPLMAYTSSSDPSLTFSFTLTPLGYFGQAFGGVWLQMHISSRLTANTIWCDPQRGFGGFAGSFQTVSCVLETEIILQRERAEVRMSVWAQLSDSSSLFYSYYPCKIHIFLHTHTHIESERCRYSYCTGISVFKVATSVTLGSSLVWVLM